jgi:cyclophilin family peptidyl-prolyl cis-trans isomerase
MLALAIAAACLTQAQPAEPPYNPTGPTLRFTMSSGKRFDIRTDPKASPKTVEQIVRLVRERFYDNQRVHRVESWVTQWGDPKTKKMPMDVKDPATGKLVPNPNIGDGESGHQLPFEMSDVEFGRGVVGIASTGLQVGGDSQIFVLKKPHTRLWRSYAVLGKVVAGMDVVDGIERGDRIKAAKVLGRR